MAQVSPVRTWWYRVGRILKPGATWICSRGAHPLLRAGLFDPAPQQLADFRHMGADVCVLAIVEPMPAVREPQIEAQPVEGRIGVLKGRLTARSARALRCEYGFLAIEGGIHEAQGHGLAMHPRKSLRLGQQPVQQIE